MVATLTRAAIGLAVACALWLLGHQVPAVVLVVVLTTVTVASLLSERVAATVDRGVQAIQRVAGKVLTVVLLGGVQLLVFTPIWLLLRLFRSDPLALGSSPEDESFWRPVPRGRRSLHARPFAYERIPRELRGGDRLPLPRARAVLGLVLLVVVLDVGLGAIVDAVRNPDGADAEGAGGLVAQDVPAGDREPWRVGLGSEIDQLWKHKSYDPYLGWGVPDVDGEYVTVSDGVRRSYQPADGDSADDATVLFLGGSSVFGLYQRDLHTIPSEFARLAEADGIPVRVVNRGALAYNNWQELLLLQQLVSTGSAPDLAVFYDGFNEILGQFQLGPHAEPTHLEAQEIDRRLGLGQRGTEFQPERSLPDSVYRAWVDASAVHAIGRRLGVLERPGDRAAPMRALWPGQTDDPERRGRLAASIHRRGVDLAQRLADSYGFEAAFFWQPFLYSKPIRPGEEIVKGWLGTDPDSWAAADRAARERLAPEVTDLSDALDGVRQPIMYDFVHTNEVGARVIARALYQRLEPKVREITGR